jgi:hypothetical protein
VTWERNRLLKFEEDKVEEKREQRPRRAFGVEYVSSSCLPLHAHSSHGNGLRADGSRCASGKGESAASAAATETSRTCRVGEAGEMCVGGNGSGSGVPCCVIQVQLLGSRNDAPGQCVCRCGLGW